MAVRWRGLWHIFIQVNAPKFRLDRNVRRKPTETRQVLQMTHVALRAEATEISQMALAPERATAAKTVLSAVAAAADCMNSGDGNSTNPHVCHMLYSTHSKLHLDCDKMPTISSQLTPSPINAIRRWLSASMCAASSELPSYLHPELSSGWADEDG